MVSAFIKGMEINETKESFTIPTIKNLSDADILKFLKNIYDKDSNKFTDTFINYLNNILSKVSGKTIENIVKTINMYILFINPKYSVTTMIAPKDGIAYDASFDKNINDQLKKYQNPATISSNISQATYQTKQKIIYVANKCVEHIRIVTTVSEKVVKSNAVSNQKNKQAVSNQKNKQAVSNNIQLKATNQETSILPKSLATQLYDIWYSP